MAGAPRLETHEKRLNPRTIMLDPLTPVVGAEIGGIESHIARQANIVTVIFEKLLVASPYFHRIYLRRATV